MAEAVSLAAGIADVGVVRLDSPLGNKAVEMGYEPLRVPTPVDRADAACPHFPKQR
jgi:hypothetical protein